MLQSSTCRKCFHAISSTDIDLIPGQLSDILPTQLCYARSSEVHRRGNKVGSLGIDAHEFSQLGAVSGPRFVSFCLIISVGLRAVSAWHAACFVRRSGGYSHWNRPPNHHLTEQRQTEPTVLFCHWILFVLAADSNLAVHCRLSHLLVCSNTLSLRTLGNLLRRREGFSRLCVRSHGRVGAV